jgi:hypothetical protein
MFVLGSEVTGNRGTLGGGLHVTGATSLHILRSRLAHNAAFLDSASSANSGHGGAWGHACLGFMRGLGRLLSACISSPRGRTSAKLCGGVGGAGG